MPLARKVLQPAKQALLVALPHRLLRHLRIHLHVHSLRLRYRLVVKRSLPLEHGARGFVVSSLPA
jgi:hypothetical protein